MPLESVIKKTCHTRSLKTLHTILVLVTQEVKRQQLQVTQMLEQLVVV